MDLSIRTPVSLDELRNSYDNAPTTLPPETKTRLRRALSWLEKARHQHEEEDFDGAFVFFWIAFNAMYGTLDTDGKVAADTKIRNEFLVQLVWLDEEGAIYNTLWTLFSDQVRQLLKNQYVFQEYWDYTSGVEAAKSWKTKLNQSNKKAQKAIGERRRVKDLVAIVFERLYTLRNQLMHGAATYQGSLNRQQVRDGANILNYLVPRVFLIILKNDQENWGEIIYPPTARAD